MDTSRGSRRLGTLCLIGLLVMITAVPPRVGYTARLATEESTHQKGGATWDGTGWGAGRERRDGGHHLISTFVMPTLCRVINLMSELTGKNFLVDDKVRGKVTIIAPKPR